MKKAIKSFYIFGIALIIIVLIAMHTQYFFFKSAFDSEVKERLNLNSKRIANVIYERLQGEAKTIESATNYIGFEENDKKILQYLENLLKENKSLFSIYYGTTDNKMINASGWIPPAEFNLRERPWYKISLKNDEVNFTEAFLNASKDHYIITLAKQVRDTNNDLIGVVGGDIRIDKILQFVKDQKLSKNGYSFIIDGNGNILLPPGDDIAPKNIDSICQRLSVSINEEPAGFSEVKLEEEGYIAYNAIASTDWTVASFVPLSDYNSTKKSFIYLFAITLIITISTLSFFISRQRKEIILPLKALDEDISKISMENRPNYRLPVLDKTSFIETRKTLNNILDKSSDFLSSLSRNEKKLKLSNEELSDTIRQLVAAEEVLSNEVEVKKKVQKQLEMVLQILSDTEESIFILNEDYKVVYSNQSFRDTIGFDYPEIDERFNIDNFEFLKYEMFKNAKRAGTYSKEVIFQKDSGNMNSFLIKINYISYAEDSYYTGNIINITPYKQSEKDIYYLKYFDSLTKLPNRSYLAKNFANIIKFAKEQKNLLALIIMNINNFRSINEAKGFPFGNQVLIALSKRLKKYKNNSGVIARLGNDEFALILEGRSNEEITSRVINLHKIINQKYVISNEEIFITVSMGVSFYPQDGTKDEDIFKAATSAINIAKKDREDSLQFYDKETNALSITNYEKEMKIRKALDSKDFMLYYQPIINIISKKTIGLEALIRWKVGDEFISPANFIPFAEKSNLIIPIGEWVLYEACSFAYDLYKNGCSLPVAVNISGLQFKDPYIINLIDKVIKETSLPYNLLELEITEGILMENAEECKVILNKLQKRGVKVSIDDFGTGYSSLSYLKHFQVDQVKIDRTFIKGIPNEDEGTIAKVIIELADSFNLDVLAEGVETTDQEEFLLKNSCFNAQGFRYFHPLTKEEIRKVICKK